MEIEDGRFIVVPGTESFAETRVFFLDEIEKDKWLIGTRDNGFFLFDRSSQNLTKYPTELDEVLRGHWLYGGIRVSETLYAFNTFGTGLLLMTKKGELVEHYPTIDGTGDKIFTKLHLTDSGDLWVGKRNSGVSVMKPEAFLSYWGHDLGLDGIVHSLSISEEEFVVSTNSGFFTASKSGSRAEENVAFIRQTDINNAWDAERLPRGYIVASDDATSIVVGEAKNTIVDEQSFTIEPDPDRSNRFWIGTKSGLSVVEVVGNKGKAILRKDLGMEVRQLVFDEEGIWALGKRSRIIRLNRNDEPSSYTVREYSLPDDSTSSNSFGHLIDGRLAIAKGSALYKYDVEADEFKKLRYVEDLLQNGGESPTILSFSESSSGVLWIAFSDSIGAITSGFDSHGIEIYDNLRFKRNETSFIFQDGDGLVWFNSGGNLLRFDPQYSADDTSLFNAQVSQVKQASTGDILFNGFFRSESGGIASEQPDWSIPVLDYESRNLTFHFSATEFINPDAVQYRYRIEGRDDNGWSEWSKETEEMISSLEEGRYTLVLQAQDEVGRLSKEARYSFVILPPWYRTIWAYLAYVILGISALISARKYILMRQAHKNAKEQAKELVREREVVKRLSEANDRLKQANKLKDEFLATTSHELRTPLTAILGFTSVLKDEIPEDADYREFLDIIEDSGSRLMDTLNSLLDLAKLRAGIMDINMESVDLYQLTFQEVVQLQDAAQKKNLKLKVRRPSMPLFAMADVHGLNRVLHNLVGNAIKFTDKGSVEVWFEEHDNKIDIHVKDTGIGIEEQFLPDLFDAFIQESDGLARTYEGTGLGLAISSGIIQLMDASIRVESQKGVGSDFIVTLTKADAPRQRPRRVQGMGDRASA